LASQQQASGFSVALRPAASMRFRFCRSSPRPPIA
jgi:hypothetical protein